MNIKYFDDKKETWQSHLFKADGQGRRADSYCDWELMAYGSTKKEAAEEAKRAIKLLIADIEKCLETFEKD